MELFKDFPAISPKEWKQKIQFELSGLDYNQQMIAKIESFNIKPFYTKQDVDYKNLQAQTTKVWEKLTPLPSLLNFANALYTSKLDLVLDSNSKPIYFNANVNLKVLEQENQNINYLLFDLFGYLEKQGNWWHKNQQKSYQLVGQLLQSNYKTCLLADASLYQNAGANHVQQLAFVLLKLNEYCTQFGAKETLARIQVKMAVGSNYFFEVAKLRAMRYLLNLLCQEYETPIQIPILAETSWRNKCLADKENNLIRSSLENIAAIQGNANALLTNSYDLEKPEDVFGHELAIKQQLLLAHESYFTKFPDAFAGAYFVEFLTEQMADKAWELFKEYEQNGGYLKALQSNKIQQAIVASAALEEEKYKNQELVLVGANKYKNNQAIPILAKQKNVQQVLFKTITPKRLEEIK